MEEIRDRCYGALTQVELLRTKFEAPFDSVISKVKILSFNRTKFHFHREVENFKMIFRFEIPGEEDVQVELNYCNAYNNRHTRLSIEEANSWEAYAIDVNGSITSELI